mgnify:CR=1 FL=1
MSKESDLSDLTKRGEEMVKNQVKTGDKKLPEGLSHRDDNEGKNRRKWVNRGYDI